MAYTEVQKKGNKKQYYRTVSVREGKKVSKKRKYMGSDLTGEELAGAEREADIELGVLASLLNDDEVERLERVKQRFEEVPKASFENRYETFVSQFTHDSTAIEGNTLTLRETAIVLFDGIVPKGKSIAEINEVIGHRKAFDLMLEHTGDITREYICEIHSLVMKDTISPKFDQQIGQYRTVQVYIRGLDWRPPAPKDVPGDMKALLVWYSKNKNRLHPLVVAIYFHVGFEVVHPFIDGNGRVGRLLMNFILHKNGYPMVNIPNLRKHEYYEALDKAQNEGDLRHFINLMLELLEEGPVRF